MLVLIQKTKNFSKMFHRSHIFISIALISTFLLGCGKQIPDDVIDPSEMEDILYDYHLANVMGDELQYNEYYKNVDKRFAKNSKLLEDATANLNVKIE